ncbi:GntR family transcriptional regulator [Donghicola eburneus]|uniref:GntR family transcriptional regulator n=1 Tax=Donghicola eburneus TaxID=393278 RepID=UPI0008ED4B82|nr:GntR family transcriptional regulator [Donghicola eburneus]SFQ76504.1 transcriptional regulator, GntR family [Donghicola eburneus]
MDSTVRQKSSDVISAALTKRIVQGELKPGDKLRQDHIAKEFGASHVPVREALLHLVGRGLAVALPRQGVRVAPLDPDAVKELKVMRLALEPVALRHSIPRLSEAQIRRAEELQRICDQAEDVRTWEAANRGFHLATIAACDMPRLIGEIDDLQLLSARHFLRHGADRWRRREDLEHRAIMTAVRKRDIEGAVMVLQRHISRFG